MLVLGKSLDEYLGPLGVVQVLRVLEPLGYESLLVNRMRRVSDNMVFSFPLDLILD